MSWFLQPLVIFPLLWLSLSTLGAFILAALIRPPMPRSYRSSLRALERIHVACWSTEGNRSCSGTGPRRSRLRSAR